MILKTFTQQDSEQLPNVWGSFIDKKTCNSCKGKIVIIYLYDCTSKLPKDYSVRKIMGGGVCALLKNCCGMV